LSICASAEVPASAIYSVEDMFRDPQYLARNMLQSAILPDGKLFKMPGIVPRLSETPGSTEWIGPTLGQHTDEVLAGLGYAPDEINALRRKGAV
jgi:formyl-CoA transferase